ncbi:MAG: Lrp/AsnC family transcriptional regulator [Oscillospiraceae bacterium]|jgi:Lrp/AsnC family leucine-responsive transcriptional regulator|nr:Lrp/AsnC family transcriptional regulator [Oscillospiraceae bacterium]
MDAIDCKILRCLAENARSKASTISQEINFSISAVIERIHKLEDNGIIRQYTMVLDHKLLGNDIAAWMEVGLEHPKFYDTFVEGIMEMPNILTCYYLTGDFDFMLQIITGSSEELEIIHRRIKSIEGVSATKTHFVLKTLKENILLLPEEL